MEAPKFACASERTRVGRSRKGKPPFGLAFGFACLALASACEKETPKAPPAAPSAEPRSEDFKARAVSSALAGIRSRLSLAAPEWQVQPLAFGNHVLGRVGDERVEAFSLPDVKLLYERPLPGARAVVELAGGSLVAVGHGAAFRIDPKGRAPVVLPPVVWVPGTTLLPERRDPALVWTGQRAAKVLARQRLGTPSLAPLPHDVITLEDYDGGPLAMLRDGFLLYRSSDGVRRGPPTGRMTPYKTEFPSWRLLPGRRVDQAWAVAADGAVELWQFADRLAVIARFSLGAPPFDVAANSEYLAAVVVDEKSGGPRRFRLVVFSNEAERVLELSLPEGPAPEGERWAELAVRDRYVALGQTEPLVAVGGTGALSVYRLPDGAVALQR